MKPNHFESVLNPNHCRSTLNPAKTLFFTNTCILCHPNNKQKLTISFPGGCGVKKHQQSSIKRVYMWKVLILINIVHHKNYQSAIKENL